MNMKTKKIIPLLITVILMLSFFSMNCFATSAPPTTTSTVADAVKSVSNEVTSQVKTIVNSVVFPILDMILVILLFVKGALMYLDYRKGKQLEWAGIIIIFVGLVVAMTAPLYIWNIIGI